MVIAVSILSLQLEGNHRERRIEMLENSPPSILSAPADSPAVVKHYAPPNQRNRSNNRRKSADRLDRTNSLGNDLEKNQVSSRNIPAADHGDAGGSNRLNENNYSGFIALEGCSSSAAFQLLNDRWTAAMQSYNNPINASERPVMHSGGTSAWGEFRLPQQITASATRTSSSMDFLGELHRAMQSANSGFST